MSRSRVQERVSTSSSVLAQKQKRLNGLKKRLNNVIAERTNMSENYLSIGSQTKYQKLNDRIAKLSFEIMVMEGGTIKDNHIAEWINKNRWKYQNPYTGEVRDFKVGDRFNLDYGGYDKNKNVVRERKDWKSPSEGVWGAGGPHRNWIGDPTDPSKFQTFEIERIQDNIESLKISTAGSNIYQLEGESNEDFALRKQDFNNKVWVKDGKIVKKWEPGASQMGRSDYFRGTDIDFARTEHNIRTNSLIDGLKISNNEAKRDLSLTNGTQ